MIDTVEVRRGITDAVPVCLGLIPLGLAFGVVVVQAGFAWWWAPVFSFVVYAGSMEYLAVTLVTSGATLATSAITTLFVNFRHLFYGLSFPSLRIRHPLGRAYSIYALTDECYALVAGRDTSAYTPERLLALEVTCQVLWVVPGVVGAIAGATVVPSIPGIDFALAALFTMLAVEAFIQRPDFSVALTAVGCGLVGEVVARWTGANVMLIVALSAFVLVMVARYVLGDDDA